MNNLPEVGAECLYKTFEDDEWNDCIFLGYVAGEYFVLCHKQSPTIVDRFLTNPSWRFRYNKQELY